jgi:hypothetical protein
MSLSNSLRLTLREVAWLSSAVGGLSVAGVGLAVVLVLMLDG